MDVRRRLKTRLVRSSSFSLCFCVSLFICGARLCFGFSFSRKMSRSFCQVGLDREGLDREGLCKKGREEGR